MRLLETRVEPAGPGLTKVTVLLDHTHDDQPVDNAEDGGLGEGPTHDAVPDHIVHSLSRNLDSTSLSGAEIVRITGDNSGTVYRQARVLATNSPECPLRLRGWVFSPERGRYALTAKARRKLAQSRSAP